MANSKGYLGRVRPSFRFLPADANLSTIVASDSAFEFHESDFYNSASDPVTLTHHASSHRMATKPSSSSELARSGSSRPVYIPDWSKILGSQYLQNRRRERDSLEDDVDVEGRECGGGSWVPPHEFLANTRTASLSVQEGVGRTLKGRDLSRLRNAIWAKTGFQD